MARVEGGAVIIETDWPGIKLQIDTRNINFKYEEDTSAYEIFAIDGQYFYKTVIYKAGEAPQNQGTYDTWRAEFESSYKDRITDFNSTQPFYLSNIDGYSVILKDGATPTVNDGYGIAIIGSDGSNYRLLKTDTSGRPILVGAGTAGSPSGGVISIQGVPSGIALPVSGSVTVSGTVTATNPSVGSNASAIPSSSTLIGGSDGTNLQALRLFDLDTGGGTQYILGVGLRKASGGGSVEAGTSSDPIRIDPTGTTTQPVSGTVAATQSGTWTVQPGNTANTTPWLTTISQGGNSATVSAGGALKVDGSAVTQPVSGTVTANIGTTNGLALDATLSAQSLVDNASFTDGTSRVVPTGYIFDEVAGTALTENDVAASRIDSKRSQIIVIEDSTTRGQRLTITASNAMKVDGSAVTQPISGTVTANAGTGTFTVSGAVIANIGTSGSLALDATLAKLTIAQSTALGSNTQSLIGGSVTTAAPTYTTGNINPLSLTTAGALRIDGSSVTQPVSGTVTSNIGTTNGLALDTTVSSMSLVDNAAFTDGITRIVPSGYIFDEVAGTALTENDAAASRIDSKRAQVMVIEDATTRGTRTTVKAASTAAVATDPALVVSISPNNSVVTTHPDTTASGTLNALNATVQIAMAGHNSVGFQLAAGTLIGTIVPELSIDGGTTWNATYFEDPSIGNKSLSVVFSISNVATDQSIILTGGTSHVRVRVSAFTSGTANINFCATFAYDPQDMTAGTSGSVVPPMVSLIGGTDGSLIRPIATDNAGRIIHISLGQAIMLGYATGISELRRGILLTSSTNAFPIIVNAYLENVATGAVRSVVSSSASDASAGVGARTVTITYYDSSLNGPFTETVTMNGTTPVNTVSTTICFVEKFQVITSGSSIYNVGTITLKTAAAGGGSNFVFISANDADIYSAKHYIPSGKKCFITSWGAASSSGTGYKVFFRWVNPMLATPSVFSNAPSTHVATGASVYSTIEENPFLVTGPAKIEMYGWPDASTAGRLDTHFSFIEI